MGILGRVKNAVNNNLTLSKLIKKQHMENVLPVHGDILHVLSHIIPASDKYSGYRRLHR